MKILTTTGLTELITKIKSSFIKVEDTVTANTVDIDATPTTSSTNLITSGGVKSALDSKQDNLPSVVNDRYLHTNSSTGALEWSEVSGGDNWELINEFITTESTSGVLINKDINNNDFMVKKIIVIVRTLNSEVKCTNAYMGFYKGTKCVYFAYNNFAIIDRSTYTYYYGEFINGTIPRVYKCVNNYGLEGYSSYNVYQAFGGEEVDWGYTEKVVLSGTGEPIPLGTKISVYGIRI